MSAMEGRKAMTDHAKPVASDRCLRCGYPLSEHGYNAACHDLCGNFSAPPDDAREATLTEAQVEQLTNGIGSLLSPLEAYKLGWRCAMGATPSEPRASQPPEWLWWGEVDGKDVVTFGRWPRHGAKWRYKLADIQPTEHDHPKTSRQTFEKILASLNYDGQDTDSLTVGEIRRAL
jgi:hypothetical protein